MFTLRRYSIDLEIQLICCGLTIIILEMLMATLAFNELILCAGDTIHWNHEKKTILNFELLSKNWDICLSNINSLS